MGFYVYAVHTNIFLRVFDSFEVTNKRVCYIGTDWVLYLMSRKYNTMFIYYPCLVVNITAFYTDDPGSNTIKLINLLLQYVIHIANQYV